MPRNVSAPMTPSARGRSWPSNRCEAAAVPTGTRMPPPIPWTTRPAIELVDRLGAAREERPEDEQPERAEEQAPGAPDVDQPAGQRHRDDVREQVAVDDPRGAAELGERVLGVGREVDDDRRQGDGRDHQLEAGEEDAGAEDRQEHVGGGAGHRRRVHTRSDPP